MCNCLFMFATVKHATFLRLKFIHLQQWSESFHIYNKLILNFNIANAIKCPNVFLNLTTYRETNHLYFVAVDLKQLVQHHVILIKHSIKWPQNLCSISNLHIPSAVLDPKHSLILLNIASNSYRALQQVTHSVGQPPNPALLIGLQLTPVSSICFCLQRATAYSRAGAGKTNRFTRKSRKFTQQSSPATRWCLLVKGKAGEASGTLQMGGGAPAGSCQV